MMLAVALLVVSQGGPTGPSAAPDPAVLSTYWQTQELARDAGNRICALDGDRSRFRPWFDRLNKIGARLVQRWADSAVSAARLPGLPRPPMMLCDDKVRAAQAVKSFQGAVDALERKTGI